MRNWAPIDMVLLVSILAGAAGVARWYLIDLADDASTEGPVRVQETPSEQAGLVQNLADRHQFGLAPLAPGEETTADMAPGYPWLLSLAKRWTDNWVVQSQGPGLVLETKAQGRTDNWEGLVRWVQCGLGTLTAGLYFLFARRAFRSLLVAGLAGFFVAFYPFYVINTAQVADGVLATFLLALCLFLGGRASQVGGPAASLGYGIGLAALAMVRAALLPFAVVALLWFLLRCRTLKRGWFCALLAFLGFTNGLVPWTLRNFQVFGDVVPIVDSTYLHLWIGNHPGADGGPLHVADLENSLQGKQEIKQNERYNALAPQVIDNIVDDPGGALHHRLSAGLCFLLGADWFRPNRGLGQGDPEYNGILAGALLVLLLLSFLGWRWTYPWRALAMPSSLAVIWIPLPYILGHAGALSGPRLPLDGVLLCYAAFALVCLVIRRQARPLFEGPAARLE